MKLTSSISTEHMAELTAIVASIGGTLVCPQDSEDRDSVDFSTLIPDSDETKLIIRYIGPRYGVGWICFLYTKWGTCKIQSSGDEDSPARRTPQTAYDNLRLRLQEKIDKDLNLLGLLKQP